MPPHTPFSGLVGVQVLAALRRPGPTGFGPRVLKPGEHDLSSLDPYKP